MPDYLPPWPEAGDSYWVKRPGEGGVGKRLYTDWPGTRSQDDYVYPTEDIQTHIEGQEYRVNTVGDRIVQAHLKGNRVYDGRNSFDYEWCGVDGIRTNGTIPLIKEAVLAIPDWNTSVLAWDIIVGSGRTEGAFVIEVNTSPGMNPATASRIYRSM